MPTAFRRVTSGALAFAVLALPLARGQGTEFPAQKKGTLDVEVWTAGIVAQHDSGTAFDTGVWLGGGRFGRILTAPHGPGWLRGTLEWDFGLGPAIVFSPRQTAYGFEFEPIIGRWNFLRDGKVSPYFEMAGGVVLTNMNVPPGDTSSVNVAARVGLGWQIVHRPRSAFDVGLYGWHLSNAWTGNSNPSANGLGLMFGYRWFHETDGQTASSAAGPSQPAGASSSLPKEPPSPQPAESERKPDLPAPAITGTPGVYTVETAEVLPKGEITASAYVNRFSRAPASVSILSSGLTLSAGVTKRITVLAQFNPYIHFHVGEPSQLSLNEPASCVHDIFKAPIYCDAPPGPLPVTSSPPPPQSSWKGPAAAFVSGYPFVDHTMSDYGPVTLGFKVNFWSETRKDPLSVSLRTDFFIPTESAGTELAKHGAQTGTFDYSFTLGLSKTLRHGIVIANNVTYIVVGNPKAQGETLLTPPDQVIFGQGFIFPIRRRLKFLTEYTATLFQEGHAFGLIGIDTENTTWGPAEPVDGVWGVRWNLRNGTAFDLGYRYMLNLHQVNNRSGFIFQISNIFRPAKSE